MYYMIGLRIVQPLTFIYIIIGRFRGWQKSKVGNDHATILNDKAAISFYISPHWCILPDCRIIPFAASMTVIISVMSDGWASLIIRFTFLIKQFLPNPQYRNRSNDAEHEVGKVAFAKQFYVQ